MSTWVLTSYQVAVRPNSRLKSGPPSTASRTGRECFKSLTIGGRMIFTGLGMREWIVEGGSGRLLVSPIGVGYRGMAPERKLRITLLSSMDMTNQSNLIFTCVFCARGMYIGIVPNGLKAQCSSRIPLSGWGTEMVAVRMHHITKCASGTARLRMTR